MNLPTDLTMPAVSNSLPNSGLNSTDNPTALKNQTRANLIANLSLSAAPLSLNFAPNSPTVSNSSPNSSLNSAAPTHQAEKYALFVAEIFGFVPEFSRLKLRFEPRRLARATIALNPGASYGSAKRWYPRYFAQVGAAFAGDFDILILGGESESEICEQIAQDLARAGVKFTNLCRKTSVAQLCEIIGGVARSGGFFVTNDSGPMHIAAAYGARTIALFGPTRCDETAPYANENARVVRLELACMPCMRRVCPLGTHECMKNLTPERVIAVMRAEMERC